MVFGGRLDVEDYACRVAQKTKFCRRTGTGISMAPRISSSEAFEGNINYFSQSELFDSYEISDTILLLTSLFSQSTAAVRCHIEDEEISRDMNTPFSVLLALHTFFRTFAFVIILPACFVVALSVYK